MFPEGRLIRCSWKLVEKWTETRNIQRRIPYFECISILIKPIWATGDQMQLHFGKGRGLRCKNQMQMANGSSRILQICLTGHVNSLHCQHNSLSWLCWYHPQTPYYRKKPSISLFWIVEFDIRHDNGCVSGVHHWHEKNALVFFACFPAHFARSPHQCLVPNIFRYFLPLDATSEISFVRTNEGQSSVDGLSPILVCGHDLGF